MQEAIRVVVVDDHLIVRQGLRLMLEEAGDDFELIGEAADGAAALRIVDEVRPDVVLMDVRMPGMDGLEAIGHIRERHPQIAVVMLTTYNEEDLVVHALQAGACGYLLKDTNRDTLFRAIRAAIRGELLLQPGIVEHVLAHTTRTPAPSPQGKDSGELTSREREVLEGVAKGQRSKEIAAHLHITENTVKGHLATIYAKLGVDSRASAVAEAMERGLLPLRRS
ncbi:MAG TPA: response regulator transcription factor [Ktedonobacterales bacterium]